MTMAALLQVFVRLHFGKLCISKFEMKCVYEDKYVQRDIKNGEGWIHYKR